MQPNRTTGGCELERNPVPHESGADHGDVANQGRIGPSFEDARRSVAYGLMQR